MKPQKYEFNECRATNHVWRRVSVSSTRHGPAVVEIEFICDHCAALRTDLISKRTGAIYQRRYKLAQGYAFKKRTKNQWRKQYVADLTKGQGTAGRSSVARNTSKRKAK